MAKATASATTKPALARSPLAPAKFPAMHPVAGVRLVGRDVGLKNRSGLKDLMVAELASGTTIAGALTRSKCPSAPVDWCRANLPRGRARAIVVNSGNANAFTGKAGDLLVATTVAEAAKLFTCPEEEVFLASTGVIGQPRPADYIASKLARVVGDVSETGWSSAAEANLTNDTFPKGASRRVKIGRDEGAITGERKRT